MLSEDQKLFWKENGYLHLRNVLPKHYVKQLLDALDSLAKKYEHDGKDAQFQIGLDKKYVVNEGDIFRDLMDSEYSFPYILDIMGPCIQLSMSHALIRPGGNEFEGFVHTDGGQAMQSIFLNDESKPLQIKIQYFLTDVESDFSGNFLYKPGSHKMPFPTYDKDRHEKTKDMKQLIVKAGDVAIFPNTLWHGAIRNVSKADRKSLIYGYNQMFLRPYDYHVASEDLLAKCNLRQRRLLGDVGTTRPQAHYYAPRDQITVIEGIEDSLKMYE